MDWKALEKRINALPQTDNKNEPHILKARGRYPRSHMKWEEEEDLVLNELCARNDSVSYIAQLLKRSDSAIEARIKSFDIIKHADRQIVKKNTNNEPKKTDEALDNFNQNQAYQMIRYWRNSLADADKMGIVPEKMKKGEQFTTHVFKNARLPQGKIQRFFDEEEKRLKNKRKKQIKHHQKIDNEDINIHKLSVIIAPFRVVKNYEHGKRLLYNKSPDEVLPVWLVADLTRDGELIPSEDNIYPWIERKCLTPNEDSGNCIGYPIIGDVTYTDEFYSSRKDFFVKKEISWKELFSFAEELFQFVLDKSKNSFTEQNYSLTEIGYLLPASEILEASQQIIATYDQYLFAKNKKIPPLLEEFSSLKDQKHIEDQPIEALIAASKYHYGQMQNKYPLSESQRKSLSYLCDEENNNIFTIHGPPGTGKTNLLLSIIASKWIESAIKKKRPPILVTASTNNFAATNLLDQFKEAGSHCSADTSIRWLPNFNSYGLYLTPKGKVQEAKEKNYMYQARAANSDATKIFYEAEYHEHAKKYFLQQFNQYYQKTESDISCCQHFIHELMLAQQLLMQDSIEFACKFYKAHINIIENYKGTDGLNHLISKMNDQKFKLETNLQRIKELQAEWFLYKSNRINLLRLFIWVPFVKPLLMDRIKLFTSKHHEFFYEIITHVDSVDDIFNKKIQEQHIACKQIDDELSELSDIKKRYEQFVQDKNFFEQQLGFELLVDNLFDFADTNNLLCKLDTTIRYNLFVLATHYWEAAWLLESETIKSLANGVKGRKKYWEIQTMLTLCFVTTLHSGPGFFQYKTASKEFETLASFIDLLIIDEAGQVMPAIAGAMISTAKKMLLVGDAKQIEPIFKLPQGIDLANTKKFELCIDEEDYEYLKNTGVLCSGDKSTGHVYGNLIVIGQRKAKYHLQTQKIPGMFLKEHRRCAKEIISYCNELCYDNQLIPMAEEKPFHYPRMGYAHIKGREEKNGGSRFNSLEAQTIAAWIAKNKNSILVHCETDTLDNCLGIVTPFAAQGNAIQSALREHGLEISKVGTIHSLQGAEKHIIIFSPVYTLSEEKQGTYFFDRSSNMLNVAVSRAKKSFLVFGDMDIFNQHMDKLPSSLLSKYLFSDEKNEIVDIIQPKFKQASDNEIHQINSLAKHRQVLKKSFTRTNKELNIVSPFLREKAIESDSVIEMIAQYSPNILINIYTDPTLNKGHFEEFKRAKKALESAGAMVILVENVHSKIITIDDRVIIEGSFNWLSAARGGQFEREESSIIYIGKHVSRFINEALDPIKKKVKNSQTTTREKNYF